MNNKEIPNMGYYTDSLTASLDNSFLAPTWDQAFDHLRTDYGLELFVKPSGVDGYCSWWEDLGYNEQDFENYESYEIARFKLLEKVLTNITKGIAFVYKNN